MHIWYLMWKFKNDKNATKAAKKSCNVYTQGVITTCQVWKLFSKFHFSDISDQDTHQTLMKIL